MRLINRLRAMKVAEGGGRRGGGGDMEDGEGDLDGEGDTAMVVVRPSIHIRESRVVGLRKIDPFVFFDIPSTWRYWMNSVLFVV